MNEFDLVLDSNANDNVLATLNLITIGAVAKLQYIGTWPANGSPQPNQLTLEISKDGLLHSFVYALVVAQDKTFTATADTPTGATTAPYATLTGAFLSSTAGQTADKVRIDQLPSSAAPTNPVSVFAIQATAAGSYSILLDDTAVGTVQVDAANTRVVWTPSDAFMLTDGNHTLRVVPASAATTGSAKLSLLGGSWLDSATLKMVAVKDLPSSATNDTGYYLLHDTQQAVIDAGADGSVLSALLEKQQVLGIVSKDGTAPANGTNAAAPQLTLANGLQLPIVHFDQASNNTGAGADNGAVGINFWRSPDPRGMNNIQGTEQDDSIDADVLGQSNNALTSRDWINAGAGNDIIATGAGGDEITGGAGNDTIDGGAQTSAERLATLLLNPQSNPWELENRVSFSGPANRYTISEPVEINGVRTVTVTDNRTDSPDGADTLTNVDVLLFTDKQIRLTPNTWVDRGWDQATQQPGTTAKGVSMEGTGTADVMGADDANFAGSDRLVGNAGNDTLKGGAGADTFRGDKGNDQIDGGANRADNAAPNTWDNNGSRGLDVAEYAGPSSRYTISKVGSTVTVTDAKGAAGDGTDTLTNVEILRFVDGEKNLVVVKTPQMQYSTGTTTGTVTGFNWEGTDLADTLTTQPQGSIALRDWVNAGAGDDLIATGGGGDWIDAGEGNDTIDGGADGTSNNVWENKDQVRYDAPLSRFTITQGEDNGGKYFTVTDGLPAAFGGFGTDKLYNIENLQFNDGNKDLNVSFNANSQGQNHVQGTDFADRIDTSALSAVDPSSQGGNANARDWVQSQAGDDVVFTGAGGDTMEDGAGNDIYDGGTGGNSTSNTWDNLDRVNFAGAQNRYTVEVLTYTDLAAGSAIRTYIDSQYPREAPANVVKVSDKVPGGDGVNYVINVEQLQFNGNSIDLNFNVNPWQKQQDGNNTVVGNNHYNGGLLADLMDATGHDAATPSTGVNGYYGNKDWMNGGAGNDTLLGGVGGDEMTGGSGNDLLDGGANASSSTGNSWDDADKARYDNIANRYAVTFFRLATDAEKGDANIVKYSAQAGAVNTLNANSQYYVPSPYYLADGLVVVQDKVSDAKGGDGRDVLKNIEILAFSDTGEWLAPNTSTQLIANSQSLQYNANGSRYGDKLVGRAAEVNWMDGRGSHDLLQGSSKSDTLTGGTGNDTLEGGSGTDTAKFAAPLSQFTVQRFEDSSGAITGTASTTNAPSYYFTTTHKISDAMGGLGTDKLVSIEKLSFSDTTIDLNVRPVTTGDLYFTLGSTKIPAETKFLATMFADKANGRTPEADAVDPTAEEMFFMYAGDDTVLAGNGADYVDAGEGNDYIELGNDPYSAADRPPPSASRDVARPGPGNDTVIGGSQTDNLVPDSTAGVPSGTQFKVTTTANGVASTSYYTDTQEDIVRYDDDAARYSIELRENSGVKGVLGSLVATYQAGLVSDFAGFDIGADVYHGNFLDANNAVFTAAYTLNDYGKKVLDYNRYVVVVRDSLSDALGGDGVDVLLGIDTIAFEGSQLVLNDTPRKPAYSGPASVVPDTAPNGYTLSTSADGQTQTLTHTSVPAGTYATLVSPTAGYIDGKRGSDNIAGTSGNDSIQGWAGDDVIDGGAGDDYIVGGIGNDTLRGGEDLRADPVLMAKGNTFNYGDVAAYKNSLPVRFEIRKLFDDASGSVTGTANKAYFRVVDTASLKTISKLNGYLTDAALAADNLKTGIGFGIDTLIDVEHIRIGDTNYVAAPGISNFKWSSGAERSYIGGTLFDDVLLGTSHGDELDGRDGNDTLDGGVEATDLPFSDWDNQDEVRYTGDRERFDVRGVLVQVGGSEASKTYTVLQAGQAAQAGTEVLNGIQVTDLLPPADGGSGTDLLVNIERLIFNSVPFNIVPRINEYEDMSAAPVNGLRPKAVNATGTDFADRLEGKGQSDWISGGRGDDTLVGGAGGDNLEGGAGNDTLEGGENGPIDPWGNAQGDTAQYKAPIERFSVSSVMLDRDGDGLAETSAIRVLDNLLAADPASLGTDILIGVESLNFNNRWVDLRINRWEWDDGNGGTSGGQSGTVFDDILTGDVRKTGGAALGQSDNLNGNAGNDVLLGLSGGDQLNGGLGNDVLDGGANGNTGEAWRDQDQVNYAGKQSQYSLSAVTVSADGNGGYTLSIKGREAAKSTASGFSITDSNLSSDVQQVLTLANQALKLADGQHNHATLVVDKLSADLGGEGADLLFNVENLGFRDGQLETEVRINANDWNRDGQLDGVNVAGTTSADVLSFDDIVSRSGKTAVTLEATQMDIDLRTGDDVYLGGAGGESVRPGAGNDYVDGGANEGQNAWGGDTRDEVRFEGKSSRYVLVDVSLSKSGDTWSVSSSKGLTYTVGSDVAVSSSNSELAPIDASGLLGMGQAIDMMVAHAGNQTTLSGWIVADRLPAAWQGTGVDALVNVEAIAFSDKWIPLNMQVFYQRAPGSSTVNAAHVDGTSRADVIGYASTRSATDYDYTGDDHLRGNEGDDNILGGNGSDWIEGGAGNDTIDGGSGGTDPQGNSRGDTVRYSGDFERYTVTANGGTVTVSDSQTEGGDGIDTLTNVEGISFNDRWLQLGVNTWINRDMKDIKKIIDIHVRGSILDDSIDASTGANSTAAHQLWGNEGNDTLVGGAGPDQFQGGAGDDVIIGGANGMDAWGNPGVDLVRYEGSFARYSIEYSVDAGATWTTLQPSSGTLLIRVTDSWSADDGGTGTELMSGIEAISFGDRYVMLESIKTAQDLNGDGVADVAEVRGTGGNDTLTGDNTNDRLLGDAGDDSLVGGAGGDWLHGGAGNDAIDGGSNGIDAAGRMLYDVAAYDNPSSAYTIAVGTDGTFTVTAGTDGTEGTDTLSGVEGLQFADRFISLVVDRRERDLDKNGSTDLVEVRGLDLTESGDTLTHATGKQALAHALMGGLGDDSLTGGDAADLLEGGAGNDNLVGGLGADRARFAGNFADYDIQTTSELTTVLHKNNGTDGQDTLQAVEELVFADRSYRLGVQSIISQDVDTNGDGTFDKRFVSGTDTADTLAGSARLANVIDAGSGNDVITGGNLGDDITPGTGDDRIDGGNNAGLNAAGNPNADRVFYRSKMADNSICAWQKASFSFSGAVEAGDVLSVQVGSKTITHVATSAELNAEVTAFAAAIQTAVGNSISSFLATASDNTVTLLGKGFFAVTPYVSNGEHTVSGSFTVAGASQTGKTLVLVDVADLLAGMFVSYSAGSTGAQTTYGPFIIEAVNTNDKSVTLSDDITVSPSSGASLTVKQDNTDTTTATTAVGYERWHEVIGAETGTDILQNVEQVMFADSAIQLSFSTKQMNLDGQVVTAFMGTGFDDLLRSSSAPEVFVGLGGRDRFVMSENSGVDVIKDFTPGDAGDVLTLILPAGESDGFNGTELASVDAIMAKGVQRGADTVFDLGAGNEVKLVGVTLSDLSAGNFDLLATF